MKTASELAQQFPDLLVFILIIAFLFPIVRWLSAHGTEKRKIGLKQIEIANSIIKPNLDHPSKKQAYLTEQLFESMYRCKFKYEEIQALLNAQNPSRAVLLFKKGMLYLRLSNSKKSFVMKKEYRFFSIMGKKFYFVDIKGTFAYFVFAMLGAISSIPVGYIYTNSIWLQQFASTPNWVWASLLSTLAALLFFFAFSFLWNSGNIRFAEDLVDEYG